MKNIKFEAPNSEKIHLGEDSKAILRSLLDGPEDQMSLTKQIESNCHTLYKIASQTVRKYLAYNDALFKKITHFDLAKICEEKDYGEYFLVSKIFAK